MTTVDGIDDTGKPELENVLSMTSALGERLTRLSGDAGLGAGHVLRALAEAQQELQAAWALIQPEYSDVARILDNQRADRWWQRKLIATLPMAVLETESDGRILWANNAAAAMLDRQVLRLVRTHIQKFVHADDQQTVGSILATLRESEPVELSRCRAVIRLNSGVGGAITVELVSSVRKEEHGERTIVTWVLEPTGAGGNSGVDESLIAHTFSELCRLSLRSGSLQELLSEVARLCEDVCASRSSVSVTIGPPAEPRHLASSTEFAQRVDAAQMAADEGPCQQSWETGEIVYSNDALADARWPKFMKSAADTGVASALAAPIRVGDEILGILNVYSHQADAFQVAGMKIIELLADAAGAVIHHADEEKQLRELTRQLEEAMRSREVIEQAKGVLMARYRCTAPEAFARLAKVSQNRNIRIRALAQTLLDSVSDPQ